MGMVQQFGKFACGNNAHGNEQIQEAGAAQRFSSSKSVIKHCG